MSLILVDGSALVYRAHYAFAGRPLTAPSGETTSVVFGFCHSLLALIETRRPERLAIVFDRKGPNFRHAMYPAYKANRKPMPPELAAQLPRLHELLAAWGVAVLGEEGVEADDVMATVAARAAARGESVWLYSGDKDFLQLVDERVAILKPGKRGDEITEINVATVRRDFGLEPAALIDVFALSGDKADNIPGAPGVGDKTALKLIQEFGTLDRLLVEIEASRLTPRLKRVIGDHRGRCCCRATCSASGAMWRWISPGMICEPFCPSDRKYPRCSGSLGLRRVQALAAKLAGAGYVPDGATATPGAARDTSELVAPVSGTANPDRAQPAPGPSEEPSWAERCGERGYVRLADDQALVDWLARLDPEAALAVDTETDSLRAESCRLVGHQPGRRRGRRRFAAAGLHPGQVARCRTGPRRRRFPVSGGYRTRPACGSGPAA